MLINIENPEMLKSILEKQMEEIFNEWKSLGMMVQDMAGIVQNAPRTEIDAKEIAANIPMFYKAVASHVENMNKLRDKTVELIKILPDLYKETPTAPRVPTPESVAKEARPPLATGGRVMPGTGSVRPDMRAAVPPARMPVPPVSSDKPPWED